MENKETFKDNMKDLFKQFCNAYGVSDPDIHDKGMINLFFNWLYGEKRDNDEFYLDQLDNLGIDYESNRTVEVGKNAYDSLVVPYKTIIVPKSNEGLEELGKRVIVGNLQFHGNLPFIIQKGFTVDHSIPCDSYKTFMTQNPYSYEDIAEWNRLPEAYHDIVVGIYGDVEDADKGIKRDMMYELVDNIGFGIDKQVYEIDTDTKYATIVTANKRTR